MAGGLAPQLVQANVKAKNALMTQTIKIRGFDGGEVERYFHEGKIKEIADYCESDIVNTYREWLRYQLFRGILSQDAFEASQQNLAATPDRCCGALRRSRRRSTNCCVASPRSASAQSKPQPAFPGID
jgi:hypothetical protein